MYHADDSIVEFGPFRLEPARRLLTRAGSLVPLGDRALEILLVLIRHAPEVVGKTAFFERVWPGLIIEESTLRYHISTLRKALGDGQDGNRYISTASGRGYCFVAAVAPSRTIAAVEPGTSGRDKGDAAATVTRSPDTNLPLRLTEIVGRANELAELEDWLTCSRLVTVVGPGGVGKTRLAVELGWRMLDEFAAGAWLIDLAPLTDRDAVISAVAAKLRVPVTKAEATVDLIVAALGTAQSLLIFDNCEHLAEAAADLIKTLLERAPGVSVLATSQTDLLLAAERVYSLDPLAVPPANASEIAGFAAVELFAARARDADRLFELDDGNSAGIGEICRHLDGLPLALEMAAGRLRMLGVEGLRRGLDDRLKMLKGKPSSDARHASLHDMLEWSHSLLSPFDQRVFRRLAVFRGSFSLEAAVAVAAENDGERWDVVDALSRLIDRSLVALGQREPPRYRLLETLRIYAREKLQEAGETDAVAERHARHFIEVVKEAELVWEETPDPDWSARYQPELDNLRGALDWALAEPERQSIAMALAASGGLLLGGLFLNAEGRSYVDRLLPLIGADTPPEITARLLTRAAESSTNFVDADGPLWAERAVALQRALGDARGLAIALRGLAWYRKTQNRHAESLTILLEAEQLLAGTRFNQTRLRVMGQLGIASSYSKKMDDARRYFSQAFELASALKSFREPMVRMNLAVAEYMAGNIDRAIELTEEAISRTRLHTVNDRLGTLLCNLGAYQIAKGNLPAAQSALEEALALLIRLRDYGALWCLQPWAVLAASLGRLAEAAKLIGFAEAERTRQSRTLETAALPLHERLMAVLEAGLAPAELAAWKAEGARWTEAEAIEFTATRLARPLASEAAALA